MTSHELPLISVVIPSFNRADLLIPTLESILGQDYPKIECIVVDGGSTDGTIEILRRYDKRIQWISEPDKGPPDAINKGWRMCKGEILAWLNADDLWANGAVRLVADYFQDHSDVDVVYGDCDVIDEKGRQIDTVFIRDWDLAYAVERCDITLYQPAVFMRRGILERVGWLYPNLHHDHDLWLRISLAEGRFHHLPAILASVRDHTGNLGHQENLTAPFKVEITKRFFELPGVPPELQALRARSISNAYLRGIDFVLLGRVPLWRGGVQCLHMAWAAVRADPSNIPRALMALFQVPGIIVYLAIRPYIPVWLKRMLRSARSRV